MNTQLVQCHCHERIPYTLSWLLVYNPLFGLNFLAVPLSELISDQFAWGMIPTPVEHVCLSEKHSKYAFMDSSL